MLWHDVFISILSPCAKRRPRSISFQVSGICRMHHPQKWSNPFGMLKYKVISIKKHVVIIISIQHVIQIFRLFILVPGTRITCLDAFALAVVKVSLLVLLIFFCNSFPFVWYTLTWPFFYNAALIAIMIIAAWSVLVQWRSSFAAAMVCLANDLFGTTDVNFRISDMALSADMLEFLFNLSYKTEASCVEVAVCLFFCENSIPVQHALCAH